MCTLTVSWIHLVSFFKENVAALTKPMLNLLWDKSFVLKETKLLVKYIFKYIFSLFMNTYNFASHLKQAILIYEYRNKSTSGEKIICILQISLKKCFALTVVWQKDPCKCKVDFSYFSKCSDIKAPSCLFIQKTRKKLIKQNKKCLE